MKWITREEIQEASKDKMSALKMSLKHHEQGRDAGSLELQTAIKEKMFALGTTFCSICHSVSGCGMCVLTGKKKGCCDGLYNPLETAASTFKADPSNENLKKFQDAEAVVCRYIKGVIEKEEAKLAEEQKPELRHGDTFAKDDYLVVILIDGDECRIVHKDGSNHFNTINEIAYELEGYTFIGNIFDDLKAMQEDVEEFEVKCCTNPKGSMNIYISRKRKDYVVFSYKGDAAVHVPFKDLPDFILKLSQINATCKRKKAKK